MQHYRINPAALKKTLRSSSTYSTSFFRCTNVSNDCGGRRYTSTHSSGTSDASGVEVLASCAARKQVRVSLDSVLDVSMGKRPWRSSFSEANPELHQHAGAPKGIPQQDQRQQGQARTISRPEVAATSCEQQRRTTVLPAGGEGQLQSAQYLHRELPVRLASAVLELDKMKDTGLVNTPSVRRVRQDYLKSFRELQAAEKPSDAKTVATFTATVKRAQARGCDTVLLMAKGLQELMWGSGKRNSRTERSQGDAEGGVGRSGRETGQGWSAAQGREAVPTICPHLGRVQDFLDNFYQNRVAMRFLSGHYLALSSPLPPSRGREGIVGLVQRGVRLSEVAQAAALEAATICSHALGSCPEVRISVEHAGDVLVAAVPEYIHYIVLELLKNAMRATMQTYGGGASAAAAAAAAAAAENDGLEEEERKFGKEGRPRPAVDEVSQMDRPEDGGNDERDVTDIGNDGARGGGGDAYVVFANVPEVAISVRTDGEDDVLLVVSDRGGGIAEENMDKVWSYLYTTAGETVRTAYLENGGNSRSKPAPLAGLGYGLPLSRLYARCFGGELTLRSVLGEGTVAIVRISRRGTRLEPLVWP